MEYIKNCLNKTLDEQETGVKDIISHLNSSRGILSNVDMLLKEYLKEVNLTNHLVILDKTLQEMPFTSKNWDDFVRMKLDFSDFVYDMTKFRLDPALIGVKEFFVEFNYLFYRECNKNQLSSSWAEEKFKNLLIEFFEDVKVVKKEENRYPHTCPRCSKPAFVGFLQVDCSSTYCNEKR